MKAIAAVAMACLVAGWSATGWCADARKSTKDECAAFLKGASAIEKDPLSDESKAFRKWAVEWMNDVEDIVVTVDGYVIGPVIADLPDDYKYEDVITGQFLIACGVYALENQKDDPVKRNVRAVESCLRVYKTMLKDHPDARCKAMDNLAAERNIEEYVKKQLKERDEDEKEGDVKIEDKNYRLREQPSPASARFQAGRLY